MRTNGPGAKRLQLVICVLVTAALSSGFVRAEETSGTFKFTKIDMELLAKANQADQEFDRKGLVFNDPEAAASYGTFSAVFSKRSRSPSTSLCVSSWRQAWKRGQRRIRRIRRFWIAMNC